METNWLILTILLVSLGAAARLAHDEYRNAKLPNRWVALLAASGVAANAAATGAGGVVGSLMGGLIGGVFLLLPFLIRAADGGDVKMLAAAGCVVGLGGVLSLLVQVSIFGVVFAVVEMVAGRVSSARLRHLARSLFDWRYDRKAGAALVPPGSSAAARVRFGIPITAGLCTTLGLMFFSA